MDVVSDVISETAWAKINLSLSVLGKRDDGYHELESLVVFANVGDKLTLEPGGGFQLNVIGSEAGAIVGENLVERVGRDLLAKILDASSAYSAAPEIIGTVTLDKMLPVAAGVGGGSADAAALIRLIEKQMPEEAGLYSEFDIAQFGKDYGADVPVCVASLPAMMRGIGEIVEPVKSLPEMGVLLVNPRVGVSTGAVFTALDAGRYEVLENVDEVLPVSFSNIAEVLDYMVEVPNDLLAPALKVAPIIGDVLETLDCLKGCLISRLSGSGATCFGLFETEAEAHVAGALLKSQEPHWWVETGIVMPTK